MGPLLPHGGYAANHTKGQRIRRRAPLFSIEPKCKACPAYDIKGMCNTGCGNVGDHATHTREQDLPLWEWAVRLMPEITAPLALVA